jgi:ADP-ribose pyrophosphatase YjhB (NUDIX family)
MSKTGPHSKHLKIDPALWMSEPLWNKVKRYIPIPCVDVILENSRGEILLGWRRIPPYRNVWALPGGRLVKGEELAAAGERILHEYYLTAEEFSLIGVFPVKFPTRSDVSICIASTHHSGVAKPDGTEFSKFHWTGSLPKRLGANYKRMVQRWRLVRRNSDVLKLSKISSRTGLARKT